ncbi:dipeptidase [candidate division WOR-3 bacterium]|nr:dipeptidase [candidate division WOR-3 bacterium]
MSDPIEKIYQKHFIADLHCDTIGKVIKGADIRKDNEETQIDIPKLKSGGVNLQVFASFVSPRFAPNHCARRALVLLESTYTLIENNCEFSLIRYPEEIKKLKKSDIGILLAIEGGDAIEGSIKLLRAFYRLGVRILTLTWNKSNRIGDSALDSAKPHNGLSNFGIEVVKEMNKLKMIIDIAHASVKTFWDVYENTSMPFISSHTGAYAIRKHRRNLKDDQIKAVSERGGIIGVFFLPYYISRESPVRIKHVVDHIDHIRDIGGIDVLALGSDFDGMSSRVKELEHAGQLPALTEMLIKRGYSENDVKKILGGNFLRFFSKFKAR